MSHLGLWLSALVDGELDGDERDHVLNHVAGCEPCRKEANAMRALKRRLTALGETSAESPIAGRLLELARADHDADASRELTLSRGRMSPAAGASYRGSRLASLGWRIAAGSAGGAMLALGALAFVLGSGGAAPAAPQITPSVDSYLMQHAYDAGQAPAGSAPSSGSQPASQGGRPALARPGLPAAQHSGRPMTGTSGATATGVAVRPASATATRSPAASPTASPAASPVASATLSPSSSSGLHPTGQHSR